MQTPILNTRRAPGLAARAGATGSSTAGTAALAIAVAVAVALAAGLGACANGGTEVTTATTGLVIQNATVVNTATGALQPGMAIAIDGGKIQRIAPVGQLRAGGSAQTVDANGLYVVPGYLDMHTHALADAGRNPSPWPMLMAHGVTGIREMNGSPESIALARQLNADSAAGRVLAPEVLQVPGPMAGGPATALAAAAQVRQHKAMGASFVKVVGASREATLAILAEARVQGLDVAGHLPIGLTAVESSNAGWRAIEHLGSGLGQLLDCATEGHAIRQALLRGEGAKPPPTPLFVLTPNLFRAQDAPFYQRTIQSYSASRCEAATQALVHNGTWQVPTLIRLRTMAHSDAALYRSDPNLRYVDKTRRALWEQLGQQYASTVPAEAAATFRQYYGLQQQVLLLHKRQGGKLLAGSDLGGIWIIPGVSLHQEFAELAAAGLTPLEVLQAATLHAAEFLHREADWGSVAEGKRADLVLLAANPLDDVANLGRIRGVVRNGRYLPQATLESLKASVAQAHARSPLQDRTAALDTSHTH